MMAQSQAGAKDSRNSRDALSQSAPVEINAIALTFLDIPAELTQESPLVISQLVVLGLW